MGFFHSLILPFAQHLICEFDFEQSLFKLNLLWTLHLYVGRSCVLATTLTKLTAFNMNLPVKQMLIYTVKRPNQNVGCSLISTDTGNMADVQMTVILFGHNVIKLTTNSVNPAVSDF